MTIGQKRPKPDDESSTPKSHGHKHGRHSISSPPGSPTPLSTRYRHVSEDNGFTTDSVQLSSSIDTDMEEEEDFQAE
ncbi:hypothetical protein CVT25_015170 [Psilocybe cyanescens]|uniref:Uncharacterized protein n=1 Tax=Psilocybe cyanescens TaxID=93625 RepID=A0A409X232_PSICY|nr:hypothetical protein CVT25_015170 [Psilocybe cyanescens]